MAAGVIIALSSGAVGAVDVNNFTIDRMDVEMRLSRDDEGRSTLATTERITATFPNYDQNHGLERQLVDEYDRHTTGLEVTSVTDAAGNALAYSEKAGLLRIGDANTYVHGQQTYVISYTQRDVTRYFSDTDSDEFYWDVVGNYWQVPVTSVNISLLVDDSLTSNLGGQSACYWGCQARRIAVK